MISGLRGLAQAFVRGAVAIGRTIESTFTSLVELGLGYAEQQVTIDYNIYDQQATFVAMASELDKENLIPGVLHGESLLNLTCKFKYDVKAVYEDLKGNIVERHWSVIDNKRLSQQEIMDQAAKFAEDYAPEEFPYHSEPEIVGLWVRAGAFG